MYITFPVSSDVTTTTTEVPEVIAHDTSRPQEITEEIITEDPITTFTRQQTLRGCTNSTGDSALILRIRNDAYKYLVSMIVTIFFV